MAFEDRLPLAGFVNETTRSCISAINDEIASAAQKSIGSVSVTEGRFLRRTRTTSLWSFDAELSDAPEVGTTGLLRLTSSTTTESGSPANYPQIRVELVAVGDSNLVLSTDEFMSTSDDSPPAGIIEFSASWVLDALRRRLDDSIASNNVDEEMVEQLLIPDLGEYPSDSDGIEPSNTIDIAADADADQDRAAYAAIEPGLRFTWGPPGTGKTTVLAKAVSNALERGQRVLIVAHANVAVDVALRRVSEIMAEQEQAVASGKILRLGTPHLSDFAELTNLLPDHIVAADHPEIGERLDEVRTQLTELSSSARQTSNVERRTEIGLEIRQLKSELEQLNVAVRNHEHDLIEGAQVIGTTLSRAIVSDQVWNWPSDVVIVDEASMAGLPYILGLALRGATTLSFFGDFRQLPPISLSKTERAQEWFARDVFELSGVREAQELGEPDRRTSVLKIQFRMGQNICETVNQLAYGGMLRTHPSARDRAIRLADNWPGENAEITIVDTSGIHTACDIESGIDSFSRINLLSAALSTWIADRITSEIDSEVALLSPYRAQAVLLKSFVASNSRINCSTIHRFQGGERDAVVLDLTDAAPQDSASRLTGRDKELSLRLLNVAASRARGKLVLVADLSFIEHSHALDSTTRRLLELAGAAAAETISARDMIQTELAQSASRSPTDHRPLITWCRDMNSAVDEASHLWHSHTDLLPSRVEFNLPDDSFWSKEISQVISATIEAGENPLIRGTTRGIQKVFGNTEPPPIAEVRLTTAGSAPWVAFGRWVSIGSSEIREPAALCCSPRIAPALNRLFNTEF